MYSLISFSRCDSRGLHERQELDEKQHRKVLRGRLDDQVPGRGVDGTRMSFFLTALRARSASSGITLYLLRRGRWVSE